MMLQREDPIDVVIATGCTMSFQYFVKSAFSFFDLDWQKYVFHDNSLMRPLVISYSAANDSRANVELSWSARHTIDDVVRNMCMALTDRHRSQYRNHCWTYD